MKKIQFVCTIMLAIGMLVGCGNVTSKESPEDVSSQNSNQSGIVETSEPVAETSETSALEDILFETENFSLTLPAEWEGKYVTETSKDDELGISYVAFFEKGCKEESDAGWLFSIGMYPDDMYLDQPSYEELGEYEGITYIAVYPTDVQSEGASKKTQNQYLLMANQSENVVKSFQIRK